MYECAPRRAWTLIARRDVAGKPMPDATKTCQDLSFVASWPQQEIHRQFRHRPDYSANQPGAPLGEVVKREIEHVAAHIVAPDRWKLVKSGGGEPKIEIDRVQARGTANIVLQDSPLVDETLVSGSHDPIAVFEFAPIQHIIRIGQPNPAHSGQAVEAAGPNRDLARIVGFLGAWSDDGKPITSDCGSMIGLVVSLVPSQTGEK